MESEHPLAPYDYLAHQFDGLEAQVRRLQNRVDELSWRKRSSHDADIELVVWQRLSPERQAQELEKLAVWVDWLVVRYASTGEWLRPCWWRHGFVVEELSALCTAWRGIYESVETTETSAALDWHNAAERCRERIRQAICTGPGCTAVAHKSDQPVTDDSRWVEERAAINVGTPETSGGSTSSAPTELCEESGD